MSVDPKHISRRTALKLSAGAAATPLLVGGTAQQAAAKAPQAGPSLPSHYRFKLGGFEITTILDGAIQLQGPHPIFGEDQFPEDVEKLAKDNFLPGNRMEISFTPVVVNTGSEIVFFDSGNGNRRRPNAGKLASLLAAAGIKPEDVDVVAITHCHADHIGGLMEGGKPLFPNARYAISAAEYDFWTAKESASGPTATTAGVVKENVVPFAAKMSMLKDEGEVVPGIRAISCHGHTPGHTAYHMESDGKRFLLWGDVTNHYVASLQRPDWHVRFDMDKEKAVAARKKILGMAATDRIPVTGYHMPFPAVGFVEKQGEGYRWVPASYQLRL